MKLSVVALFAAGAMAAVVPDAGSYGEEAPAPAPSTPAEGGESPEAPAPAPSAPVEEESPEAPEAPEEGSYEGGEETPEAPEAPEAPEEGDYGSGEEQPAPTSAPVEEESPEQPSTVLDTEVVATVTDCGPEVTDCAAPDVTSTIEVTTSICETEEEQPTEEPVYSEPESASPEPTSSEEECEEETSAPAPVPEEPTYSEAPSAPLTTGDSSPEEPTSVCVPETNVKTITTEYTTVVPTTILETETIPCASTEESSPEGPTGGSAVPSDEGAYPEPSSSPSAPGNET